MTEPVKKTNTSAWMTALKQYNYGNQWLVPKRDTPEYQDVLNIANEIKASLPPKVKVPRVASEVKPKRQRKVKPEEPVVNNVPLPATPSIPVKKVRKPRKPKIVSEEPVE